MYEILYMECQLMNKSGLEGERKPRSLFALKVEDPTSFREKIAWVMFAGTFLSGFFFVGVLWRMIEAGAGADGFAGLTRGDIGGLLSIMIFLLVVTSIIGAIISALLNVDEAEAPLDERDKIISGKAARLAEVITGMMLLLTLGFYFVGATPSIMACGIIAAMWAGTLVDYGTRAVLYRRGV